MKNKKAAVAYALSCRADLKRYKHDGKSLVEPKAPRKVTRVALNSKKWIDLSDRPRYESPRAKVRGWKKKAAKAAKAS